MQNLRDETGEGGYEVAGELIDLTSRMEDVPDHVLERSLPPWGWSQWLLCALSCVIAVAGGFLVLSLLGGLVMVAGSR